MTTSPKRRRPRSGFGDKPTGDRRIAIYVRRSTDDERQPFSIDAQLASLRAYIASQPGWTLVGEPFSDDASGATTNRPGLQRALHAAQADRFDVLLVYRVDRFTRRLSDLLELLGQLDEAGVAFVSATEPFDTSTSIGRMLVQLLGVFAEFERETIIDRVINGMAAKAQKGQWVGGNRPYGYHVDRPTQKLTVHEAEAPIVREIARLYVHERLGTRAIATELNRRGITNRTGKRWSGLTIGRILESPAYAGDISYADVYVADAHPALIDRDTWRRIREIADARTDGSQRAMSGSEYHLTGLITCPDCGNKYIGTSARGRNQTYRYYTCYSRSRYGTHGCSAPRLDAPATDDATLQALYNFYSDADTLIRDAIAEARNHRRERHEDRRAELDTVQADIIAKSGAIERYLTAFEAGTLDDTIAGERIKALKQEIVALSSRRDEITDLIEDEPTMPEPDTLEGIRAELRHAIAEGASAERKALIERLIAEIKVTADYRIIPVFRVPLGAPVRALPHMVGRAGLEPATEGL
ncbi:recombinase family protein [Dactylosporangium sp. NPDC005555]|uniref:recombinase family protein n=1 Tax=Dactylosporangium sp. NPDC005555 TaxID=3154889 RepID=UPI0033AA06CF